MGVIAKYEKDFNAKDNADMKKFIGEFFSMLKSDGEFKRMVLEGCRKK
jgi:hypothetical protein